MPLVRAELTANSSETRQVSDPSGAKSGALDALSFNVDTELVEIVDAWPTLSQESEAGVMAMIRNAKSSPQAGDDPDERR